MSAPYPIEIRERAIELLAEGQSNPAVAETLGISRSTVHGWVARDPTFRAALDAARKGLAEEAHSILAGEWAKSIVFISALRDNPAEPSDIRLRAAQALLAHMPAPEAPREDEGQRQALEAAAGGPEALRAHIGAALAESYGFGAPIALPAGMSQPPAVSAEETSPAPEDADA